MSNIRRSKPPCEPDCPRRSEYCHATCSEYNGWRAGIDKQKRSADKYIEAAEYTRQLWRAIRKRQHKRGT